jgi:hypothetical protein
MCQWGRDEPNSHVCMSYSRTNMDGGTKKREGVAWGKNVERIHVRCTSRSRRGKPILTTGDLSLFLSSPTQSPRQS